MKSHYLTFTWRTLFHLFYTKNHKKDISKRKEKGFYFDASPKTNR